MLMFVAQDGLMKGLLGTYPVWMLISVRGILSVVVMVPAILYLGWPHRLLTPLWPLHLARAALFALGFALFYAAFPFMNLAEVSTIFFSAPLMTALFAWLFLGERIGPHRSVALIVGFIGVVIAMKPTADGFRWIAVLPLLCAFTYALSQILARRIGDRESTLTVGLYTISLGAALMAGCGWLVNQVISFGPEFAHLRWDWPAVREEDWLPVLLLGTVGMIGYTLLSRAYQVANASLIAPFDYSYLPFAAVMAFVIWDEVPSWQTLTGMTLIILSGLYVGYRELVSHRARLEPPAVAEAVFIPGAPTPAVAPAEDVAE